MNFIKLLLVLQAVPPPVPPPPPPGLSISENMIVLILLGVFYGIWIVKNKRLKKRVMKKEKADKSKYTIYAGASKSLPRQ